MDIYLKRKEKKKTSFRKDFTLEKTKEGVEMW